ncbi:MAG: DUF790 family protein [Lentisphaeria bacterium]|nr:DUF790 family protein [Lentisphaeria bacterium]
MLKKEHIICKIASGRVKPAFVPPDDPLLLAHTSEIISIYRQALENRLNRSELDELSKNFIDVSADGRLSSGLNKLLLDRCQFEAAGNFDYPARRRELFIASAARLNAGLPPLQVTEPDIYGDLPGFERLTSLQDITPEHLLEAFNLAQAQALLIYADSVKFKLDDPDVTELRRVMKAIKFFRLLADFERGGKGVVNITVSGPYSLFGPSAKYAIALASLLPAVVNLQHWKLQALLKFRDRELTLKLDEKSQLRSPKRSFSSYVPEEIRLYHKLFAEKSLQWQIVGDTPFLDGGNQEIIFPDLSFQEKSSGKVVHLELFHRWHSSQLAKRLELLRNRPDLPLLLGIDRALADEEKLAQMTAGSPLLQNRCWLFRDFPGVENTLRALKKMKS